MLCLLFLLFLYPLGGEGAGIADEEESQVLQPPPLLHYLETAHATGIIDEEQMLKLRQLAQSMDLSSSLLVSVSPASKAGGKGPSDHVAIPGYDPTSQDRKTSLFMRVYNQLTLLNVLYLSGAVVIMGAYTVFMTLAVERCNYAAMSFIMAVQVGLFGGVGVSLWHSEEYMYVGGM